jgi:hypothetical protein
MALGAVARDLGESGSPFWLRTPRAEAEDSFIISFVHLSLMRACGVICFRLTPLGGFGFFVSAVCAGLSCCVTMSSSAFSFEDFDALLLTASADAPSVSSGLPTRPPSLTASSSSVSSSSPHGESPSFVAVGSPLLGVSGGVPGVGLSGNSSGGGIGRLDGDDANRDGKGPGVGGSTPAKRVGLVLEPSSTDLCLGLMTSAKFCTRALAPGSTGCGVAAHARKFQPPPLAAFLKDTEVRALCSPALDLSVMSPAQRLRIQGVQLTAAEWVHLFQQVQQRTPPKWLRFEDSPVVTVDTSSASTGEELLSPTNMAAGGLLSLIPMLSFDDSTASGEDVPSDMDLADVTTFIHKFRAHFASLKAKWAHAFTEVESGYGLVVQDLQKLQTMSQVQSTTLGRPVPLHGETPPTVWEGLRTVHETVATVTSAVQEHATSIDALAADQTNIAHSVLALETQMESSGSVTDTIARLTVDLRALEYRVVRLVPLLTQLRRGQVSGSTSTDQGFILASRIEACEQSLDTCRQAIAALQDRPLESTPHSSSFESSLREVRAQMKQLQLKVVGKGVQIANKTFQTFDDVKVWVDTHLPNHRYGLFVDSVSIFEFFTAGHIDAETTYSSFYSQHRTGFKSTFEARVASSVQNLFPSMFGKSDSNVDTAEALPALPTPAKWDSNDGNTGLRYQIMRNMADVELQLQETINTVLSDYSEAQHIARECLHHSKRFAMELCQFFTLD